MASVPFGQAARATRTVSSGIVPSSWGYIDITLLLLASLLADFFLPLYHSSIACIRQQSLVRGEPLGHQISPYLLRSLSTATSHQVWGIAIPSIRLRHG